MKNLGYAVGQATSTNPRTGEWCCLQSDSTVHITLHNLWSPTLQCGEGNPSATITPGRVPPLQQYVLNFPSSPHPPQDQLHRLPNVSPGPRITKPRTKKTNPLLFSPTTYLGATGTIPATYPSTETNRRCGS